MNASNYKLFKSDYPLAPEPKANLIFTNLLSNQSIQAPVYLVETAQFLDVKNATWHKKVKYPQKQLLSIKLKNVDGGFFLHYWLKKWRNMLTPPDVCTLTLPGYFRFKLGDTHLQCQGERSQETEIFCWKLPLPT